MGQWWWRGSLNRTGPYSIRRKLLRKWIFKNPLEYDISNHFLFLVGSSGKITSWGRTKQLSEQRYGVFVIPSDILNKLFSYIGLGYYFAHPTWQRTWRGHVEGVINRTCSGWTFEH